jgi:hypothetical protein
MSFESAPVVVALTHAQSDPIDHFELYVPHVVFALLFLWLHMYTFKN